MVAARLLATHPHVELVFCTSDKWTGAPVRARTGAATDLLFVENARAFEESSRVDAVLLATSAEVSLALVPRLVDRVTIVDLSGAFRLRDPSAYARWYRFEHTAASLLSRAHYGLVELFGAAPGKLVANPGCYPTAAILALGPLLRDGLIEREGVIVDALSGVTGAGRQAREDYSFAEIDGDARAYKLLTHQHTPEIAQALTQLAGGPVKVTFTAHLAPLRRGILATCYARPRAGVNVGKLEASLRAAYRDARFVEVVPADQVTVAAVVGTNVCRVGVACDDDVVVVVSAIDNLVKGAAGQAVQNLNRALGLDDGAGLDRLHRSAP